jgi:hypothetical protein
MPTYNKNSLSDMGYEYFDVGQQSMANDEIRDLCDI